MNLIYSIRGSVNYLLYRWVIRPLVFLWEAEKAHMSMALNTVILPKINTQ
jgi:hypothetical protein